MMKLQVRRHPVRQWGYHRDGAGWAIWVGPLGFYLWRWQATSASWTPNRPRSAASIAFV